MYLFRCAAGGESTERGKDMYIFVGALCAEPLHDIVITNIVWCIAYKREVGRESYTDQ